MASGTKVVHADICVAYDTEAQWNSANPVLLSGQVAYSSDRDMYKCGDGTTAWRSLRYNKAVTLNGLTSSVAELNYCKGVTSNIQVQINRSKIQVSETQPAFGCLWFKVTG